MKQGRKAVTAGMCLTVLAALLLAGCGSGGGPSGPAPGTRVDIRGYIASISEAENGPAGGVLGSVLIEGGLEEDTAFDRADVTVTVDTKVYVRRDGGLVEAGLSDLQEGQYVQASFTGPVAESYPVQATAGEIVVLDSILNGGVE